MTTGVVNLLKPPGMTSHDAVSFVRRIYRQKKVGHSGTLDPAAAGVLPVYLGSATRLVEYGDDFNKEYRAEILFGISTDTGDDTGTVLSLRPAGTYSLEGLDNIVSSFQGVYEQVPPMYSAIKIDGRKLYELAREGKDIPRVPRRVEIKSIRLLFRTSDRAVIHVACSKGTYIRTLCEDIGTRIGTVSTMSFLLRTRVGPFEIDQAHTLEEIAENPLDVLLPADTAVSRFPGRRFDELEVRQLKQGRAVASGFTPGALSDNSIVCLYSKNGGFFGMGRYSSETGSVNPNKIFNDGNENDDID